MRRFKASVIIPVYNTGVYLRKCIDSVLAQTFHDFEIICVDDGSTDNSVQILEEYCKKHRNIKVLRQKNKGAGAARNRGLLHAQGEYVFFLDSDDVCSRKLLACTISVADREKTDVVCFDYLQMGSVGIKKRHNGYHREWLPEGTTTFSYRDCPDHILSVVNPVPWNKLFRRSFLIDNRLRYEEISSTNDITFASVSCAMAGRIAVVDKALYCYRIGHDNTISSTKTKNLNNIIAALDSTIRQVKDISYYDEIKKALARFVLENTIYALEHYIPDIGADSASEFYSYAHDMFSTGSLSEIQPVDDNEQLYYKYRIIQTQNYESIKRMLQKRIIVSLTSYPERIRFVEKTLDTIYAQTHSVDEVVLWLSEEHFPEKEKSIPKRLVNDIRDGRLTIRWCDNLELHRRYFYAFQEFRNDLIVTVDDDLLCMPDLIQKLRMSYLINPYAVSAARTHLITFDENDQVLPYKWWIKEYDGYIGKPSKQLFCLSGTGALYPAELFPESSLNKEAIIENCLKSEDIWLKILETDLGIPVVAVCKDQSLLHSNGMQENQQAGPNMNDTDACLEKSIEWLEEHRGKGFFQESLLSEPVEERAFSVTSLISYYRSLFGSNYSARDDNNTYSVYYIYDTMAHLVQDGVESKSSSYVTARKRFTEHFLDIMKSKGVGKEKKMKAVLLLLNLYGPFYKVVNRLNQ